MILQIICVVLLVPACMVCGYYWFLALIVLTGKRNSKSYEEIPKHTFAIVIPAHDEERIIAKTLRSCDLLDYPKDKFKVFVIADNCSDKTAEIAIEHGAICLEREDSANYGKGYALAWAFERIPPEGFDAIVVLDADCSLDSHGLNVFDKYLSKGDRVLQASDVPSNPDESAISYAVSVGNLLENDLFYFPKSRLGMAVFLRGTGFVLHRDILKKYPWREHSNVEDVEYTVKLLRNGIGVKFISEVKAKSKFPTQKGQLNIQRTRWAGGNLSFGKKHAFKLIWQGMINKKLELLDAGWTFLVLSRPLVLFELFLSIVTVFLCVWLVPGTFSGYLLLFSVILVVLYGLYFIVGIFLLGLTCHRVGLLLGTPFVVIRLIGISLLGLLGDYKNHWARTPR